MKVRSRLWWIGVTVVAIAVAAALIVAALNRSEAAPDGPQPPPAPHVSDVSLPLPAGFWPRLTRSNRSLAQAAGPGSGLRTNGELIDHVQQTTRRLFVAVEHDQPGVCAVLSFTTDVGGRLVGAPASSVCPSASCPICLGESVASPHIVFGIVPATAGRLRLVFDNSAVGIYRLDGPRIPALTSRVFMLDEGRLAWKKAELLRNGAVVAVQVAAPPGIGA